MNDWRDCQCDQCLGNLEEDYEITDEGLVTSEDRTTVVNLTMQEYLTLKEKADRYDSLENK